MRTNVVFYFFVFLQPKKQLSQMKKEYEELVMSRLSRFLNS